MGKKKKYITDQLAQHVLMNIRWGKIQELPQIKGINKQIQKLEKSKEELTDKLYSTIHELRSQKMAIPTFDRKIEDIKTNIDELNIKIKEKEEERSEMISSLSDEYNMNRFKEFYPNYYQKFESDFDKSFEKWVQISANNNINPLKNEIKSIFEDQIVNNLNANPHLVQAIENKNENIFNNLAEPLVNMPIRFFQIVLASISQDKAEFGKTVNQFQKVLESTTSQKDSINNELAAAQNIIKIQKGKIRTTKSKELTIDSIDKISPQFKNTFIRISNDLRKKNGKLNFSEIGRTFGISNHTAKSWCQRYNVPINVPYLN